MAPVPPVPFSSPKGKVNSASEKLGEHGSDAAIKSKFPNSKRIYPPEGEEGLGGAYNLDRVYQDGDRIIVVEAKGGSAELGTRKVADGKIAQQGTEEYLRATIESMKARGGEFRKTAIKVEDALNAKRLDYYKAKTPIGTSKGKAKVNATTLQKFDM